MESLVASLQSPNQTSSVKYPMDNDEGIALNLPLAPQIMSSPSSGPASSHAPLYSSSSLVMHSEGARAILVHAVKNGAGEGDCPAPSASIPSAGQLGEPSHASGSEPDPSSPSALAAASPPLSLWDASKANPHSKFVQELISHGADVNAKDQSEWTPLHVAAYYGQEEICDALVHAPGINLEARNKHGETALHLAAKWPHDKAADSLCRGGADPNASNRRGRTPLHTAALFARRTVLEKLVAAGGNVNAVDNEQATPLHLAVRPNNAIEMDLVTLLLKAGASLEAEDVHGRKPITALPQPQLLLHFAAAEGQVGLMRQLTLSRGCKLEDLNPEGLTPLHVAAMRGDVSMVKALLSLGAKPNVAAARGKANDMMTGLSPGGIKFTTKQMGDRTALHFAAEKGAAEVLQVLLTAGAKVNQPSECGMTSLHLAVWHRHPEAIKVLLRAKADVHSRVKTNGMTPLHYAAFNQQSSRLLVGLLVEKGADVEARTQEGWTPLHLAATSGCLEVVHELLLRGARVSAKGRKGQTALDCARKRSEVTALLGAAASGGKRPLPTTEAVDAVSAAEVLASAAAATSGPSGSSGIGSGSGSVIGPSSSLAASTLLLASPPGGPFSSGASPASLSGAAGSSGSNGVPLDQLRSRTGVDSWGSVASSSRGNGAASASTARGGPAEAAPGSRAGTQAAPPPPSGSSNPPGQVRMRHMLLSPPPRFNPSAPSSLSALLQTLQNYNLTLTPASSSQQQYNASAGGTPAPGSEGARGSMASTLLTPATLARMTANGPSPPELLAQLQDALSNAMRVHGGDGGLTTGGSLLAQAGSELQVTSQCSLQPGSVFGHFKCLKLQTPTLAAGASSATGNDAGSDTIKAVLAVPPPDDKLLYMYCSNNCGFQFHHACWKVAKERLKQLHPKFTGFSANRGESSMLPCLSSECAGGVIDEVFMGTAQSCMELYRMKPAGAPPSDGHGHPGTGRPWQDLLTRGDQLLKELQAQDTWVDDGSGTNPAAGAPAIAKVVVPAPGPQQQEGFIARTVVSSASDMVDAISKLADVLGSGPGGTGPPGKPGAPAGGSCVTVLDGGAGAAQGGPAAAATSGAGGGKSGKMAAGTRAGPGTPPTAPLGLGSAPVLLPPPLPTPSTSASGGLPQTCDSPLPESPAAPLAGPGGPSDADAKREAKGVGGPAAAAPAAAIGPPASSAAKAGIAAGVQKGTGAAAGDATGASKKAKKKAKGGEAADEDLPAWLLADIQASNVAAAAAAAAAVTAAANKIATKGKKLKEAQRAAAASASAAAAVAATAAAPAPAPVPAAASTAPAASPVASDKVVSQPQQVAEKPVALSKKESSTGSSSSAGTSSKAGGGGKGGGGGGTGSIRGERLDGEEDGSLSVGSRVQGHKLQLDVDLGTQQEDDDSGHTVNNSAFAALALVGEALLVAPPASVPQGKEASRKASEAARKAAQVQAEAAAAKKRANALAEETARKKAAAAATANAVTGAAASTANSNANAAAPAPGGKKKGVVDSPSAQSAAASPFSNHLASGAVAKPSGGMHAAASRRQMADPPVPQPSPRAAASTGTLRQPPASIWPPPPPPPPPKAKPPAAAQQPPQPPAKEVPGRSLAPVPSPGHHAGASQKQQKAASLVSPQQQQPPPPPPPQQQQLLHHLSQQLQQTGLLQQGSQQSPLQLGLQHQGVMQQGGTQQQLGMQKGAQQHLGVLQGTQQQHQLQQGMLHHQATSSLSSVGSSLLNAQADAVVPEPPYGQGTPTGGAADAWQQQQHRRRPNGASEDPWERTAAAAAAAWQLQPVDVPPPPPRVASGRLPLNLPDALLDTGEADQYESGYDADWAMLKEAMRAEEADNNSLACMPTTTPPQHQQQQQHLGQQQQRMAHGGQPAATGGLAPLQRFPTSLGGSAVDAVPPPPPAPSPQQQQQQPQQQQQQQLVQQHILHQQNLVLQQRHQQTLAQQQQLMGQPQGRMPFSQQQQTRGGAPHQTSHGGTPVSGETVIASALAEMKAAPSRHSSTCHLLLECPDIALIAATPAMLEAWMVEHVGRFGGISAWRVIAPCGAVAVSLADAGAAEAAAVGLAGTMMLMRPLATALLSEFPNNEHLAAHMQKVATRMIGSGTAYIESMASCWQKLQELPPPELRGGY